MCRGCVVQMLSVQPVTVLSEAAYPRSHSRWQVRVLSSSLSQDHWPRCGGGGRGQSSVDSLEEDRTAGTMARTAITATTHPEIARIITERSLLLLAGLLPNFLQPFPDPTFNVRCSMLTARMVVREWQSFASACTTNCRGGDLNIKESTFVV